MLKQVTSEVGGGWEGGEGTAGGRRKDGFCYLRINDKLSPLVTWKIKDAPNKLVEYGYRGPQTEC